MSYLDVYAHRFVVLDCVRFERGVLGMEYDGVAEDDMATWEEWGTNDKAFGYGN
jgi:dimethylaniline monooxygenase (N-oxide forming)